MKSQPSKLRLYSIAWQSIPNTSCTERQVFLECRYVHAQVHAYISTRKVLISNLFISFVINCPFVSTNQQPKPKFHHLHHSQQIKSPYRTIFQVGEKDRTRALVRILKNHVLPPPNQNHALVPYLTVTVSTVTSTDRASAARRQIEDRLILPANKTGTCLPYGLRVGGKLSSDISPACHFPSNMYFMWIFHGLPSPFFCMWRRSSWACGVQQLLFYLFSSSVYF